MHLDEFTKRGESVSSLINDLKGGRMPQALLISGETGIGKRTLAGQLAAALLCSGDGSKPCGTCRNCKKMRDGSHPDFYEIKKPPQKNSISIEQLRDVLDVLSRYAFQGGNRVILCSEAEAMTQNAQNCILKSLEEAAQNTYFILVTGAENALLPTIRSRCRILRMSPLPDDEVVRILREELHVPPDKARTLAEYAEGSIGRARESLENEEFWQIEKLVEDTFLSIRELREIPVKAKLLKDMKDKGEQMLDILCQKLRKAQRRQEYDDQKSTVMHLSEAAEEARRMMRTYVGWQAVVEKLLMDFSEEKGKWQQS